MRDVQLPIDVVPNTNPPIFVWRQAVDTPNGRQMVDHRESLPPHLEVAVQRMVTIVKQLLHDNAVLRGQVEGMASRISAQAALLERKAELQGQAPASAPLKKSRG